MHFKDRVRRCLTPAFSGAVNGIGRNMRIALHGLRCNALLCPFPLNHKPRSNHTAVGSALFCKLAFGTQPQSPLPSRKGILASSTLHSLLLFRKCLNLLWPVRSPSLRQG